MLIKTESNVFSVFEREIEQKSIIVIKNKDDKRSITSAKKTETLNSEKKLSDFLVKLFA
jgi:hypothetical protein